MDQNEILVMALAAGVSGFYALMVFLSSRRRRQPDRRVATAVRPVLVRSEPSPMPVPASDSSTKPAAPRSPSERGDTAHTPAP